jgi:hypothetical protein
MHSQPPPVERRRDARKPVIKSVKIAVGSDIYHSFHDGLVLNETWRGALLDLGAPTALPEIMTLYFGAGPRKARLRWSAGPRVGVEFLSEQILTAEHIETMKRLGRMLHTQGLPTVMAALRAERFFGNDGLRKTAEAAEAAFLDLETRLTLG